MREQKIILLLVVAWLPVCLAAQDPPPGATGDLTLEQALALALEHSPVVAAAGSSYEAAGQRVRQAGRWPNPELELEAEELGGPGELSGLDSAEISSVLSQEIPLGGEVGKRSSLAASEHRLAETGLETARLDLRVGTTLAFHQVLLAQEQVTLAAEMHELARSFFDTVSKRVEAGKVSPVEATRARTQMVAARIELERARRGLAAARSRLASTWGGTEARFRQAAGALPPAQPPPPLATLRPLLEQAPELQQSEEEIRHRQLAVQLVRAERIPNLTISVGPRYLREAGITTWVAGLSLPLPLFDRNQHELAASELEVKQAEHQAKAVRAALEAELAAAIADLSAFAAEIRALEDEIIPAASQVLETIRIGYQEGKLGFLEVLDAQRELFETRQQRLSAYAELLETRALISRLVVQPIGEAQ
jgi:cobalt-zinc-cadmium efflux system outer membrane protein